MHCAYRSRFPHNLCNLFLSCCVHKCDFCHNLCIVILPCYAHRSGFYHNPFILIFAFRVYTWFVVVASTIHRIQAGWMIHYLQSMIPRKQHDTTEATSTLRLRQKVKRDKINALYRHLKVLGNPDLIDLDRFKLTKNTKTSNTDLLFLDGNNQWQPLYQQKSW